MKRRDNGPGRIVAEMSWRHGKAGRLRPDKKKHPGEFARMPKVSLWTNPD